MPKGLYDKYLVQKADGSPVEPGAKYFVLRYDNDRDALFAAMMWAARKGNWELVEELSLTANKVSGVNEDLGVT
jgi:hypothetical protein